MELHPSEFWRMEPKELFWWVECNLPAPDPKKSGELDDVWLALAARLD